MTQGPLDPPPEIAVACPGWTPTLAYHHVPHRSTWRLTGPDGAVRFAKVDTGGDHPTLRAEYERLIWAAPYLPVPTVVALQQVGATTVLVTEALPGRDATDPAWHHDLPRLVDNLGRGLRRFHEAVGEEWCPFRFDIGRALDHVQQRIEAGVVDTDDLHDEHAHLTPSAALAELEATAPADEDLVVCHGDACVPNALLTVGRVSGYVDLGELGTADRWWDIAVGAWSVVWNFGPEHEARFYDAYGVTPDPERIRFFRLLYDLVS